MPEPSGRNDYPTEPIVNGGELPDLFALPNGRRVQNREEWSAGAEAWRGLQPVAPYNVQPYKRLRSAFAWSAPEGAR